MNRAFKIGIVGLLVVSVLAVGMAGTVLAQDDAPTPVPKAFGFRGLGRGAGCGLCGEVGLEAAAGVLGMDAEELSNQLWAGETLADLADEAGVDLQDVRDAVETACDEARETAMRDAIQQALDDDLITQEQADWLLEGLELGYMNGPGFGLGRGFGHGPGFGHGRGFGRGLGFNGGTRWSAPQAPAAPATGNST